MREIRKAEMKTQQRNPSLLIAQPGDTGPCFLPKLTLHLSQSGAGKVLPVSPLGASGPFVCARVGTGRGEKKREGAKVEKVRHFSAVRLKRDGGKTKKKKGERKRNSKCIK